MWSKAQPTLVLLSLALYSSQNFRKSSIINSTLPSSGADYQPPNPDTRIINGEEVSPPFKYPWMAAIRMRGGPYCGGVLYADNILLTAGHCSKSGKLRDFTVLAHRHNVRAEEEREHGYSLRVKERIVHPEHDVAIWVLENPRHFRLSSKIEFAPLHHGKIGGELKGKLVTALGWGWLKTGGPGSNKLMQVDVPLVEPKKCSHLWHRRGVEIDPDTQVCAGWPEGRKDTCKGDSGGPLFYTDNGVNYLVGLTSFGDPCAKANTPTVYMRASYFRSWIKKSVGSLIASTEAPGLTGTEIPGLQSPIDSVSFPNNQTIPVEPNPFPNNQTTTTEPIKEDELLGHAN